MQPEEKRMLDSIINHLDKENGVAAQIDDNVEDAKRMQHQSQSTSESVEFGVMCECLRLVRRLSPQSRVRVLDWLDNRVHELNHAEEEPARLLKEMRGEDK